MVLGGALGPGLGRRDAQSWHPRSFPRGRRGTILLPRSFCVASVALMVLGNALGPGLGGRDACGAASLLRGRRGTIW